MKKQILILVVFLMATFAGVNKSYGQVGLLSPAPGTEYTYTADAVGAAGATSQLYSFVVTQNVDLVAGFAAPMAVAAGNFTVNAGDSYITPAAGKSIRITWTVAAAVNANPFYLIAKYTEVLNGCTTENIKVWQIKPAALILAIVPASSTGADITATPFQCAANITTAVVTPNAIPTNATVAYTYGKNTLYYKVTASGMLGTWRPDIQVTSGIAGGLGQIYESAEWNTLPDGTGTWTSFGTVAGTPGTTGTPFVSPDASLATINNAAGTSYLVRIVINNMNFETLNDQAITVGVDGFLPPAFSVSDIVSAADPTTVAPYGKTAVNTITKRPTITTGTATFVTKLP